uniref:GB1/RHD3-type G domain-containing protein n=1 Tax=Plectus sambesii TaxID=2011161 RepID=A0A914VVS8_9BILA
MKKEANKVPFDGPIQIAKIDSENSSKIIWDRELIKNIFCAKEIANLTVAIISIAGAYRQGKSFLLNFFIMFLRALKENYIYVPSSEWKDFDWLYDDQVIKGFEYKAGTDRVTTGIWMWGEPIVVPARNGKLMAIVLLDTQGAFDMVATTNESKNIFALSTGLSSVQIYNVSKMFQEDQMQHLALFAQCGQAIKQQEENRVVKSKGRQSSIVKKKFQKLLIVIRDHQNDEQYSLGKTGGTMLIEDALKEQNNGISNPEAILVRKYIKENFETIEGFNLPHPGFDVSIQTRRFDGAVSKIEKQFKEFAKKLVVDTMLFAMLEPKSVDGVPITCDFMPLLFEQFVSGCENQDKIRGFCDALENIEHSQICTTAATNSMEYYLKEMKLACTNRISSDEQLNDISKKAMDKFLEETQDVSERNHHIRTPFLFLSFGIDAYDTFALIRDFKKPSEMSEHLEKKVLPEFTKARIHLSRELNRKLGVTRAMEIIERKREDISRRESLPPPFTEDRITLRTRCDSI